VQDPITVNRIVADSDIGGVLKCRPFFKNLAVAFSGSSVLGCQRLKKKKGECNIHTYLTPEEHTHANIYIYKHNDE
jgi:hypothetical protein